MDSDGVLKKYPEAHGLTREPRTKIQERISERSGAWDSQVRKQREMLREFSRAVLTMGMREESMNGNWDVSADIMYPAFLWSTDEAGLGGGMT